jgi:hypothetical protein
MDSPVKD